MMLTVHHLANSRSQRILWQLEELGVPYEVVRYERDAETNLAPPELKDIHPLGKSPVIEHDGRTIAESGAIIEYLCRKHGDTGWWPELPTAEGIANAEWMQFGESSFFVPVMLKIYAGRLGDAAAPIMPRIDDQFAAHVDYAEAALADSLNFVGNNWTAADIMMSFPAEIAVMQGMAERAPRLAAFVEAVHARPAWRKARERGGPYFFW